MFLASVANPGKSTFWNDVGLAAEIGADAAAPLLKTPEKRALADCWLANSVPNATVCFQMSVLNLKVQSVWLIAFWRSF